MSMPEEPPPSRETWRLDYVTPKSQDPVAARVGLMIAGVVCGIVATIAAGFAVTMADERPRFGFGHPKLDGVLFGFIAIASFIAFVQWVRRGTVAPRWLLAGFLLGVGLMGLVEGLCFFRSS